MTEIEINSHYKILVVDDVAKNIQLVANFLTQAGYQVNFALDGKMAISHAQNERFDLILLDIMMPEMDGLEVCEKLKKNPLTADIPIIFLTAKTDEVSISKGFETGGVDYIVKPFNPQELLARVRTHLKLKERERELWSLNQTKDKFLSIIGHDIKTPVGNIVSLGELLLNSGDELEEEQKTELLIDIIESGRQGIWLLENLLSWTRLQTGKIILEPVQIIIEDVVVNNKKFIQPVADRKSISLVYQCDEDLKVFSDLTIINTIIRNLLSNAVKFTPQNGEIKILARKSGDDKICISVIDNGVGISKERLNTIFGGPGQSTPGTQNEKGSGIGLSLVKELCDLIGAAITVESELGTGTNFTVCLNASE
ncbi:MAG: hybrid sensor histidine kinase/response regulator [Bacteroidales bacterium]|nr:hybrid sensor histidine kinase/response regulator [Bacteroidales bacterium]MBN2819629.1 hybrid sensor histidine kinase/response regulator [Bacteroidales bacterium]